MSVTTASPLPSSLAGYLSESDTPAKQGNMQITLTFDMGSPVQSSPVQNMANEPLNDITDPFADYRNSGSESGDAKEETSIKGLVDDLMDFIRKLLSELFGGGSASEQPEASDAGESAGGCGGGGGGGNSSKAPGASDTGNSKTPDASSPGNSKAPSASGPDSSSGSNATTNVTRSDLGDFSTAAAPAGSPLSPEEADKLALQTMDQLIKDFDLTPEQAAGVVGNLAHESAGMNPHVNEFAWVHPEGDPRNYGPPHDNVYGYGWAQWTGSRKTDFLDFAKQNNLDPGSPAANYAMLKHEMETSEAATVPALKATTTVEDAAVSFRTVFERAAMPNDGGRLKAAQDYLAKYKSMQA